MDYLKHFINEEIYLVPDNRRKSKEQSEPEVKDQEKDVVAKPSPTPEEKPTKKSYPLCVLRKEPNEEERSLLQKILGAINFNPEEVQQVDVFEKISAEKVVIFGTDKYQELQDLPIYEEIVLDDKKILIVDELPVILKDVNKKRLLWTALQQMFKV